MFNRDYMPWLEEDEIESHDPLKKERHIDRGKDVYNRDCERFRKLCKKHGFNYRQAIKDYEQKKAEEEKQKSKKRTKKT